MSLINGMMGVTLELTEDEMKDSVKEYLLEDEAVEKCYQIVRDLIIFTDRRIIIVDYHGFSATKIEYHMIPYKTINRYIIETPGNLDTDYSLKLFMIGSLEPIEKSFRKNINILELNKLLSTHLL